MDKEPKTNPSHYMSQPSSYRLEGLFETLTPNVILLDNQVKTITKTDNDGHQLIAVKNGQEIQFKYDYIITAMPHSQHQ